MAEVRRLRAAQIHRDGEPFYDLEAHGIDIYMVEARNVCVLVPIPQQADDWVRQLITNAVAHAIDDTVDALTGSSS